MKTTRLLKWIPIITIFTCTFFNRGQAQNHLWTFPGDYVDFSNPSPLPQPLPTDPLLDPSFVYDGASATHMHNAIGNQSGEIEFFIVDQNVYNGLGHLIGELYSSIFSFAIKGYTESLIVPVPNKCDRYYIIQAGRGVSWSNGNYLPHFAILDMSQPSGYNDPDSYGLLVDIDGNPINSQFSCYNLEEGVNDFFVVAWNNQPCAMAVTDENDDKTRFLFVSQGKRLFRYLIDENGIHYDQYNVLQPFADPSWTSANSFVRSEMELVRTDSGHRLATAYRVIDTPQPFSVSSQLVEASDGPYSFTISVASNAFCDNAANYTVYVNGVVDVTGSLQNIACGGTIGPIALGGCAGLSGSSPCEIEVEISSPGGNFADFTTWLIQDENEATVLSGGPHFVPLGSAHVIWITDIDEAGYASSNESDNHVIWMFYSSGTDQPYVHGLEFTGNPQIARDASKLYVTHNSTSNHPNPIEYYDLTNSSAGLQPLIVANALDFESSQIASFSNGMLVFATDDRLAALVDPHSPNPQNWIDQALPGLNYGSNYLEVPNPPDGIICHVLPKSITELDYSTLPVTYPYGSFTAQTTELWEPNSNPFDLSVNGTVRIEEELVIPTGVHVTMVDMRFEFYQNARVIIEPGGRLTMDNTVFTTGPCHNDLWLGVEVHGNANLAQTAANQGYLSMTNNSVIENAYVGAMASSREGSFDPFPASIQTNEFGGGIIRATDSRFRNNQRGVTITRYQQPLGLNACMFTNCDFVTDAMLNDPELLPLAHAVLFRVSQIRFRNSSFRNTVEFSEMPIANRGTGILSVSATFRVEGQNAVYESAHDNLPISDNVHQTFYRLNAGIISIGEESHPFSVSNMEFQLNRTGIIVWGSCFETITFNNFEVPEASPDYPSTNFTHNIGVYLLNSYLFTVEENYFFSTLEQTRNGGLVVDNSSMGDLPVENEVYRNQFHALNFGIGVVRDNRGETAQAGLQTRCNIFTAMDRSDIVLPLSEWRDDQGAPSSAQDLTNNVFSIPSYSCANLYRDVRVSNEYGILTNPTQGLMFRYHHLDDPISTPQMDYLHPDCPQPNMENVLTATYLQVPLDYEEYCRSNFTPLGEEKHPIATFLSARGDAETHLTSALAIYQATIDGGETEDIMDLLQNIHNEESAYLRDLLLARYPLSREALMAAIEAAESFDPWHLTQVLVANSRLPGDVYRFLHEHEILPPFFMQFVDDAQTSGIAGLRILLQAEIAARSYEKSVAERAIHRHFLHHPDTIESAEWMSYVQERSDDYYKLYRVSAYNDLQQSGLAQQLLDSLDLEPVLKDWKQFVIDYSSSDTVTSAQINTAWDFFQNEPIVHGNAWGWLYAHGESDSLPAFLIEDEPRSFRKPKSQRNNVPERYLQAWPNPTKDRVVLTYPKEAGGLGMVQIFNLDGRLVREFAASDAGFQEIYVTGWPAGIYIAKLIVNNKDFDTVKLSVVK